MKKNTSVIFGFVLAAAMVTGCDMQAMMGDNVSEELEGAIHLQPSPVGFLDHAVLAEARDPRTRVDGELKKDLKAGNAAGAYLTEGLEENDTADVALGLQEEFRRAALRMRDGFDGDEEGLSLETAKLKAGIFGIVCSVIPFRLSDRRRERLADTAQGRPAGSPLLDGL